MVAESVSDVYRRGRGVCLTALTAAQICYRVVSFRRRSTAQRLVCE